MSLNRSELRSWLRLMNAMQTMLGSLDRQLREDSGISHDDYRILSTLYRAPGRISRMKDLADVMSYSPSRLTHAVARLERHGWVSRSPARGDRRGVEVFMTEAGVAKAKDASRGHLELVRRLVFDTPVSASLPEVVAAFDEMASNAEPARQ